MTKILVSVETDDQVHVELLEQLAQVELYDPNNPVLNAAQRAADVLIPPYRGTHRALPLLKQLPDLRMVQMLSAGTDEWLSVVPSRVILSSARGGHAGPVSEWVLSAILCLYRQWPGLVEYQRSSTWAHRRLDADTLAGKRVLIIGAGHIGSAVASKLPAFQAIPTLVGREARTGVHSVSKLFGLLPHHEVVVITAPLTEQTRHLINKAALEAMPDQALLINAGRGAIVDTNALVDELQTHRLRAALDVTDPEPLPAEHPLWGSPGVIISPHMARTVPGTAALCYEVAAQEIEAFLEGREPSNAALRRTHGNATTHAQAKPT
jgi:phosphoglycerate dehydrogenase-like enzyme